MADILREEIAALLRGRNAHEGWQEKLNAIWGKRINIPVPGGTTPNVTPFTPWILLQHMQIALDDILEFIRNPDYVSRSYPDGYWPLKEEAANEIQWRRAVEKFKSSMNEAMELAADPAIDLLAEIPHAPGYTIFRELLLIADHNSYHLGQLGFIEELPSAE